MNRVFLCLGLVVIALGLHQATADEAKQPLHERNFPPQESAELRKLQVAFDAAELGDNYDEAIKLAEELLALRTRFQGADHWEAVDQKWVLAEVRLVAKLSAADRAAARSALQAELRGRDLRTQGAYDKAIPLHRQRLAWCEKVLGEDHPETGLAVSGVARNLDSSGHSADAEPLYKRALAIWQKTLGETHPLTSAGYNNLAMNLDEQGRSQEAQPLHQQGLKIKQLVYGDDHDETIIAYNNLALNLEKLGKCAEAEALFRRALASSRRLHKGDHRSITRGCLNLANCLGRQGKVAEALPLAQESVAVARRVFSDQHPHTATCLNALGIIFLDQGRYAEAEAAHRAALEIRRKTLGNDHPHTATSLNNLAGAVGHQEHLSGPRPRFKEAAALTREALEIWRRAYGERHPETAVGHNNLAGYLASQGQHAEALQHYQAASDIYREMLGEQHPRYARSLQYIGSELSAQGNLFEGEEFLRKALALVQRTHGEFHEDTIRIYQGLTSNLLRQGNLPEAQKFAAAGNRAFEGVRVRLADGGLQRSPLAARNSSYPVLAAICAELGDPVDAWNAAEAGLARGLLDAAAANRGDIFTAAERKSQTELARRLNETDPLIAQLASQPSLTESQRAELDKLQAQRRDWETQLTDIRVAASQRELGSLAAVQGEIPEGAAIVMWVDVTGKGTRIEEHWGCVVRSTGEPHWERLAGSGPEGRWRPTDSELPSELGSAMIYSQQSLAELEPLRQQLREQRIAPLLPHLRGVNTLYVIRVDSVSNFPIDTIAPEFTTISYIPSGSFLAGLAKRPRPTGNRLLALGDPIFGDAASQPRLRPATSHATNVALTNNRDDAWQELPGTRVEVAGIARLFGVAATSLLDSSATEESLAGLREHGELAQFRYLHFATHGELNDHNAYESALILSKPSSDPAAPPSDGRLSANEVLQHWRLNAELVTLSACDSGLGITGGGEGEIGFSQAFLGAGSRSVCLSSWKVDDLATALLMQRFYRNLLGSDAVRSKPLGKAAALAEAKAWLRNLSAEDARKMTADMTKGVARGKGQKALPIADLPKSASPAENDKPFSHPKYWAAFVLIGDPH